MQLQKNIFTRHCLVGKPEYKVVCKLQNICVCPNIKGMNIKMGKLSSLTKELLVIIFPFKNVPLCLTVELL